MAKRVRQRTKYPRFITERTNRRWSIGRGGPKGYVLLCEEPDGEVNSPTVQLFRTRVDAERVLLELACVFEASGNKVTWEVPII